MKKQLISFTEPQADYLKQEAKRLGISIAELVRRSVDWYRDTYPALVTDKAEAERVKRNIRSDKEFAEMRAGHFVELTPDEILNLVPGDKND